MTESPVATAAKRWRHVDLVDNATVDRMPSRLQARRLEVNAMYVCPRTGTPKSVKAKRVCGPGKRVSFGGLTQYCRRENAWWEVRVRNRQDAPENLRDIWLEREVATLTDAECTSHYGGNRFATSKRLLTTRETRDLYRRIRLEKRMR